VESATISKCRDIAGTTTNDDGDSDGHGRTTRDWELRRAYGRGVQTLKRCNTWWRAGFSPCARRVSRLFRVAVLAAVPQATLADHSERKHKGRPVARESTPHPVDETHPRPASSVAVWRFYFFFPPLPHRRRYNDRDYSRLREATPTRPRSVYFIRKSDVRGSCTWIWCITRDFSETKKFSPQPAAWDGCQIFFLFYISKDASSLESNARYNNRDDLSYPPATITVVRRSLYNNRLLNPPNRNDFY